MIDSASPLLFYLITGLPIAGLALMALFLFSLSTKKDRFIIPATVLIFLALAGWGAAVEYGHLLKKPDREEPQVRQVTRTEPAAYEEETAYIDEEPEERTELQSKGRDRGGTGRLIPAPRRRKVVNRDSDRDDSSASRRKIIRRRAATSSSRTKESTTARREEPPPVRQPEPEPETRQPKPSRTTEPAPAPEPSREPRSTPTPSPPARSGSANLTVKIRG
ncbi:MAG: hypothetical protein R6V10_15320, partial [bacterium]